MRFFWAGLLGLSLVAGDVAPAQAQKGSDRPGGDYARFVVPTGDPAVCQVRCDREARCRAWAFSYPGTAGQGGANAATCWLKSQVKPLIESRCCVAGIKGGALGETRPGPVETGIDRFGGDYRHFDFPSNPDAAACNKACEDENRCRAWTYVRPGYHGAAGRCFLKDRVTPPRRKPCCISGVVR